MAVNTQKAPSADQGIQDDKPQKPLDPQRSIERDRLEALDKRPEVVDGHAILGVLDGAVQFITKDAKDAEQRLLELSTNKVGTGTEPAGLPEYYIVACKFRETERFDDKDALENRHRGAPNPTGDLPA
ncbi:MAG: hypothetical protein NVSMB60_25810 [Mycobacterium sp.]